MSITVARQGSEFLVNTTTADNQYSPTITGLTNGGFVVTWDDYSGQGGDADGSSIKAQMFGATGAKVGGEFLVNTAVAGGQYSPTITGLTNGGFVITWYDYSGQGGDADAAGIKAQVFSSTGTRIGGEFLVNTTTASHQYAPTITGLTNGGFVVTWTDVYGDAGGYGIKAQVFGATGAKVGGEFLVNTITAGSQLAPTITGLTNGGFVVTWYDYSGQGGDADGSSIKAQVFGATGTKVGGEFLVNTITSSYQQEPTITGLTNGGFVVTWYDASSQGGDADGGSVKAQVFSTTGTKVGGEFLVNTITSSYQQEPTITGLTNGGFVVTWYDASSQGGDADGGSVKAQVFSATGAKVGGEFLVNTITAGSQFAPTITGLTSGGFVVTWYDYSRQGGDADGTSIKAQIFAFDQGITDWKPGLSGEWATATNWSGGTVPGATADVTIPDAGGSAVHVTGTVAARSVIVARNIEAPNTFTLDNATLTTSGAVTVEGNDNEIGYTASAFRFVGTSTLNAGGGLAVGIDAQVYLGTDLNLGSATTHATINGAVQDDGFIGVAKGSLVVNGAVAGAGRIDVSQGGRLEITGAATLDAITLGQKTTTILNDAAHSTARIFTSDTADNTVLDFKNAGSFGGSLWVQGRNAGIDLVGAASATLTGTNLHVVMRDGHALDIKTYLFPDFINGATPPSKGIVTTADDGHGGLDISFVSGYMRAWKAGLQGDAATAANWVGGVAPGMLDDVVVRDDAAILGTDQGAHSAVFFNGPSQTYNSLTADFSKGGSGGVISVNGTLTLAEALTVTGSSSTAIGSSQLDLNTSVVNASQVVLGQGTVLLAEEATINAPMQFDGHFVAGGPPSHLTINGAVTGTGEFEIYRNGTLDLNGASTASIYLDGGTVRLGQAASTTGVVAIGSDAVSTLDLKGGTLGGSLQFFQGSTLDLVGFQAKAVTANGGNLRLTAADGTALDLKAYYVTSGSGPQPIDAAQYVLPARVGPLVTSDGHGGTLLSFMQGTTKTWVAGDWSNPASWQSGSAPNALDSVTVATGTNHAISSDVQAYDLSLDASGSAFQIDAGSLTLTGDLTVNTGTFTMAVGTSLTADDVSIGRFGTFGNFYGFGGGFASASVTVHADVHNEGAFNVETGRHVVVDGTLSGGGYARVDFGGTLEIAGTDSQNLILLESQAKLVLDSGTDSAARISVNGHATLDLADATHFGGLVNFNAGPGTTLDLVGIRSAVAENGTLHVTTQAGASFDIAFTTRSLNRFDATDSLDPRFQLLVSDDGQGTTRVGVQSKVEHAPDVSSLSYVVRAGSSDPSNPGFYLGGYDQDDDPLTLVSVGKHGSAATPVGQGGFGSIQGEYGSIFLGGLNGRSTYNLSTIPTGLGQHPKDVFDYTISDGRPGGTATGTISIVIDRAATAQDDTATVYGTQLVRTAAQGVLANDSDPDGDAIYVSSILAPDGGGSYGVDQPIAGKYGTLTLKRDGSYTYVLTGNPPAGAHETFSYTVRGEGPDSGSYAYDGSGDSTATLDLTFGASPGQPPASVPLKGAPNSTKSLTDSDGAKIVARYDAKGVVASVYVSGTDGGTDSFTYKTIDGQAVLISETQVHADKTKDVFLSNVTGRSFVAEHDRYNAAGTLVEVTRTHADSTLDYRYVLSGDGTRTTDQYDAAGVIRSHVELRANGYSDTQTFTNGILTKAVVAYAPGGAETSNTKLFTTAGVLTSETQLHADKTKDVFLSNVTGRSFVAEHDRYNAAGTLVEVTRTHADSTLDYRYVLSGDGTRTTDQYDAVGVIRSHVELRANGYSDTQTFTNGILTKAVVAYPPGGAETSNTKLFTTAGVLTSETQLHADKTKDVFLSNVTGRTYVAEHDRYNAAGTLVEATRTHADSTLDYRYVLSGDGTRTTDQYDAAGVIRSHVELRANGYSDTQTFVSVGGQAVLASDTIKYAPGGAETSNTKIYATGSGQSVLVTETQIHTDKTKDIFHFNIKNANYLEDHYAYSADGKLATLDVTYLDGSHAQTAYQAGQTLTSTPGVVDTFKSFGGDTFVFASGFGKDVITGLRAGSGPGHDILVLDQSQVLDFADLQASHLSAVGKDTLVTLSATDTILLKNVSLASLTTDDFRFQDHGAFHV